MGAVLTIGVNAAVGKTTNSIMCNLRFSLLVLAVTMALSQAFPTFDSGNYAVPLDYLGALGDLDEVHSLSKRSPITPFKPINPIIAKATLGLSKPFAAKINPLICLFTLCKNKKFGLVL